MLEDESEEHLAILKGRICPYCHKPTVFADSREIYGENTSYGMMYICRDCQAYVGVHKGTANALGRLANKTLRVYKQIAHQWFDSIRTDPSILQGYSKKRSSAYKWLAIQMDLPTKYCHIGMFDEDQCKKVIRICQAASLKKDGSDVPNRTRVS